MEKLILTYAERDALNAIPTFDQNSNVMKLIENEFGILVTVDDTLAAAERAYVLANPTDRRKYIILTPKQYYELYLINVAYPDVVVFNHIMNYVTGVADAGFPRYAMPQDTIIEVPRNVTIASTPTLFFKNARPNTNVIITVKDDAGATVGAPITVLANAEGAGSFTFTAPAGVYCTVQSAQTVVTNAESGHGDLIHTMISYIDLEA